MNGDDGVGRITWSSTFPVASPHRQQPLQLLGPLSITSTGPNLVSRSHRVALSFLGEQGFSCRVGAELLHALAVPYSGAGDQLGSAWASGALWKVMSGV